MTDQALRFDPELGLRMFTTSGAGTTSAAGSYLQHSDGSPATVEDFVAIMKQSDPEEVLLCPDCSWSEEEQERMEPGEIKATMTDLQLEGGELLLTYTAESLEGCSHSLPKEMSSDEWGGDFEASRLAVNMIENLEELAQEMGFVIYQHKDLSSPPSPVA